MSVLRGRPWGGCCTLVHNSIVSNVKCLLCAERFVIIDVGNTLVINVYLPSYSKENHRVIQTILTDIHNIVCLYPNSTVILGGDLNTDMSVVSSGSKLIRTFMKECNLIVCTDIIPPNCNYTFSKDTQEHFSFIDYFLVSKDIGDHVLHFEVLVNGVNLSDHMPIKLTVNMVIEDFINTKDSSKLNLNSASFQSCRLRWDHCNLDEYYSASFSSLQSLMHDVNGFYDDYVESELKGMSSVLFLQGCKQVVVDFIESSYSKLTSTLVELAKRTVPKLQQFTLKFWWNDELNDLKRSAADSNSEWILWGRPKTGLIADRKKSDKYAYKLAIRKYREAETKGITDSLLESLVSKDSDSFWKTWKSKLGASRPLPKYVNGEHDPQAIADSFSKFFAKACSNNSDARSKDLHSEFCNLKRDYKSQYCNRNKLLFSTSEIFNLISNLKVGKAAGLDNLTAEHLRNAHPIIAQLLAKLFNLMIIFEYVPDAFGRGILIPIPKNNSGKGDVKTEDYRGISLNPVISKLFEHCLLVFFTGTSEVLIGSLVLNPSLVVVMLFIQFERQ